jgi:hypothetical protein
MSQYVSDHIPTLCSMGPRPFVMTGYFVQWMQAHFANLANLTDRDLAQTNTQFLWEPGRASELRIASYTDFDPQKLEKRPAIIIKRNGFKTRGRDGINNRMMGTFPRTGFAHFANNWTGSHTFFCLAGRGAEAEKLAAEVYLELLEYGSEVRRTLNLLRFEVMETGDLAILQEARENFVVPVAVAYSFEHAWVVRPSTPKVRQINLSLLAP